jgi:ferritin
MRKLKFIMAIVLFTSFIFSAQAQEGNQVGKLDGKMQNVLNEQVNAELYAAYLYLSMAAYFESKSLVGAAHWMRLQAKEETEHAMKFFDYVHDRGDHVTLTSIKAPPSNWESPLAAFQDAYLHEQKVTSMINRLAKLADQVKDVATLNFLQFFIEEQVEELASTKLVVDRLTMIGDSAPGLLMIDRQLGEREEED